MDRPVPDGMHYDANGHSGRAGGMVPASLLTAVATDLLAGRYGREFEMQWIVTHPPLPPFTGIGSS